MRKDKVSEAAWLRGHSELTRLIEDCGKASRGRYNLGCRCKACREARSAHDKSRARRRDAESSLVDAEPVRRRIESLRAKGYTYAEIERLSGISVSQLRTITVGRCRSSRSSGPVRKVNRSVRDAVFGIRQGRRRLSACQRVDASWMRGWLVEYDSRGVGIEQISKRTGLSVGTLRAVMKGQARVEARTFHAFLKAKPSIDRIAGRRSA